MAQLAWVSFSKPTSLVNISTEAIALQSENVVVCIDLITKAKSYYRADSTEMGAGISLLAGHNRFPLFAFAEGVLQPRIFVIKYPELTQLVCLSGHGISKYVDLRFSEHGHIVALTGSPSYMFHIWNYRINAFYCSQATNVQCTSHSIMCSSNNLPVIVNYSVMTKEVFVWELCLTAERYFLHCRSKINLDRNHTLSSEKFHMTFFDDGGIYIIDDYGILYSYEIGHFKLKKQFTIPSVCTLPQNFSLYYCKGGLLVTDEKCIYFLKIVEEKWTLDWTIEELPIDIIKMIYNNNHEILAVDRVGNVYHVEVVDNTRKLMPFSCNNINTVSYVVNVKGIREEVIILLTDTGDIRTIDISRPITYSVLNYPKSKMLTGHNTSPYIVLICEDGVIHFFNYEKVRNPVYVGYVEIANAEIIGASYFENSVFLQDESQEHHIVRADTKKSIFYLIATIDKIPTTKALITREFLVDMDRAVVFVNTDINENISIASEMFMYHWKTAEQELIETNYMLPHKCRNVTMGQINNTKKVELYAIRENDSVIDIYILEDYTNFILSSTIETNHFANINGIGGVRNLVTWGVDCTIFHYKMHKKVSGLFMLSRVIGLSYVPRYVVSATECFNGRYLLLLYENGNMKVFRLSLRTEDLIENRLVENINMLIQPITIVTSSFGQTEFTPLKPLTDEQKQLIAKVERQLKAIKEDLSKLIEYDISVTGKSEGIYKKFCLNTKWLNTVEEQWRLLCSYHRKSLENTVNDKTRIRDWIHNLVTSTSKQIGYKLRAIFSSTYLECYGIPNQDEYLKKVYDLYYLYDLESMQEDVETEDENRDENEPESAPKRQSGSKSHKFFIVKGDIFEHCESPEFRMEDTVLVTQYQMFNHHIKFKALISSVLRKDFNKKFHELENFKKETIAEVKTINTTLQKIHDNMNCMLGLLGMETFEPEPLSVPEFKDDEVLDRVMTVDDSEVKAINRRKKKVEVAEFKSGRMLLWSEEFWARALMTMMDGVLEKLWEEEIKKDIPIPEFMLKKDPHEFSIEEQRQLRDYEEKVSLLEADRRKYLEILHENEAKTTQLKDSIILRFNEKLNRLAITKLQYDFHIKVGRLRDLNLKLYNHTRTAYRTIISQVTDHIETLEDYINNYAQLKRFWEKSVADLQTQMDALLARDRSLERLFKTNFVGGLHPAATQEILKLYKKRPKMTTKPFSTTLTCLEAATRIVSKKESNFPLPRDVLEFIKGIDIMDEQEHAPHQVETKTWEAFVKLRRQKIEMELKIKGVGFRLADAQNALNTFTRDYDMLQDRKEECETELENRIAEYTECARNKNVIIVLTQGQVEVNLNKSLIDTGGFILLNIQDLRDINDLIKAAGEVKLKTMERIALFRRTVKHEEWEHKMLKAELQGLKYKLNIVQRAKVSKEGLALLRNWFKAKREGKKMRSTVGLIDRISKMKVKAAYVQLDRVLKKVESVEEQIEDRKRENKILDRKISQIQVDITYINLERDMAFEERRDRYHKNKMDQIMQYKKLIDTVRNNHAKILELTTILELQRLRTYPTLGPAPEC